MAITILNGDARDMLATLPDGCVQCVVTSPPYYGLRSYLPDGHADKANEIGLEETAEEYTGNLVSVFREVKRVLADDGVCWIVLGDRFDKGKQLQLMPYRVAMALQADSWILRSSIVWHKPNPLPERCKDRPTSAHESVFLLTKRARYAYYADAVAEPAAVPGGRACGPKNDASRNDTDRTQIIRGNGITRNCRNVWQIAPGNFRGAHFATFPVELARRCIKAGSRPGDTVLDPFFGAGTTGLVADRLGRDCVGIELNPAYAELARSRIADARGPALEAAD